MSSLVKCHLESFRCAADISNRGHKWASIVIWYELLRPLAVGQCAPACVSNGCFLCLTGTGGCSSIHSRFISYLAESCFPAKLGNGLIKLCLLLREVLLVESEQLLALFVLLLHACRTGG